MKSIFRILVLFFGISCFSQELIFENLFDSSLNSEIACYRIPAILKSTNGTLIAAIDERNNSCGDLKWNRNINIVIRKSYDDGKTWSEIEKIIDYPDGESASDPSMILDQQTGHIFHCITRAFVAQIASRPWLGQVSNPRSQVSN